MKEKKINMIAHSAKGSTWEDHKYIKRINGLYYYPDSYEGGRHLSDEQKKALLKEKINSLKVNKGAGPHIVGIGGGSSSSSESASSSSSGDLSESDVDRMAREVIRGNYGNGQERRDALGEHYQQIQDRVNQMMKSGTGSKKVSSNSSSSSSSSSSEKKGTEATKKAVNKTKSINLDQVYSVYNKNGNKTGSGTAKEVSEKKKRTSNPNSSAKFTKRKEIR